MTSLERTRQQLDPVGTLSTRVFAIVLALLSMVYAVSSVIRTTDQIVDPVLAVLALVWLGGAAITVIVASSPRRAPFTASTHLVVQILTLASIVFSSASQWGTNTSLQDDFGSVSLGLLIVAMGVYRPARELASFGTVAAIFIGFIALLSVPGLDSDTPAASFVLASVAPVLSLAYAAAAYSGRLVRELERWEERAATSVATVATRLAGGIEESVRQDRLKILDREVFPFLDSILRKETLAETDRAQARAIADSIRELMVAEADLTWLEVVARDEGITPDEMRRSVVDDQGRATRMVAGQRTVLRAFISDVRRYEKFVPHSMKVTITGGRKVNHGVLSARLRKDADDPEDTFAPYFAVMRIVFPEMSVNYRGNELTLRFSYEHR